MTDRYFKNAVVRLPGEDAGEGLTTASLGKPNLDLLRRQHLSYVDTLGEIGLQVEVLPHLKGFPDAYFVEDAAVVLPEVAIITNSGASSRRGEHNSIESCLAKFKNIVRIHQPGTIDGGDVLAIDRRCFVGISQRTNRQGANQLAELLQDWDYQTVTIDVRDGLHLKSSVNHLGDNRLIVSRQLASRTEFDSFDKIVVSEDELYSANTLWVNDVLLTPAGYPTTLAALSRLDLDVCEVDVSEIQKMDGGLTCMSLRF